MKKRHILAALALSLWAVPAAAVSVLVEDGELVGARDLQAGDVFVDVDFVDGTCAEVFNGCDALADFPQLGNGLARSVLEAIRDDVLVDSDLGAFDSNALLTRGCERGVRNLDFGCGFAIPLPINDFFGSDVIPGALLVNLSAGLPGRDMLLSFGTLTQSNPPQSTWVVVSNVRAELAPIPLPAALPLALVGLGALGLIGRRARS